jgi:hypothetical protein
VYTFEIGVRSRLPSLTLTQFVNTFRWRDWCTGAGRNAGCRQEATRGDSHAFPIEPAALALSQRVLQHPAISRAISHLPLWLIEADVFGRR